MELFNLKGKVAIVTGCNTGLGKGMAIGLAKAGADIFGVNRSDATDTKNEIEALGRRFIDFSADLADLSQIPSIIHNVKQAYGHIDILVNNAGIIRRSTCLEFSEEDWDSVMDVNLKNLFFLTQAVAKEFVRQKSGGKVINIASMLSFQGGIRVSSYTASKHGVTGITKLLANELAGDNIQVNAIAPGYMATNNTKPLREDPERNKAILARIPTARWGNPEDLEGAVVFLASSASDYVNGHTLAVDGGWLAR